MLKSNLGCSFRGCRCGSGACSRCSSRSGRRTLAACRQGFPWYGEYAFLHKQMMKSRKSKNDEILLTTYTYTINYIIISSLFSSYFLSPLLSILSTRWQGTIHNLQTAPLQLGTNNDRSSNNWPFPTPPRGTFQRYWKDPWWSQFRMLGADWRCWTNTRSCSCVWHCVSYIL